MCSVKILRVNGVPWPNKFGNHCMICLLIKCLLGTLTLKDLSSSVVNIFNLFQSKFSKIFHHKSFFPMYHNISAHTWRNVGLMQSRHRRDSSVLGKDTLQPNLVNSSSTWPGLLNFLKLNHTNFSHFFCPMFCKDRVAGHKLLHSHW